MNAAVSKMLRNLAILIVLAGLMFGGWWLLKNLMQQEDGSGQMGGMPPGMVMVARPETRDVRLFREFTGATEAVDEVEIRARVQGYLQAIHFEDGSDVNKGDLLFEIEPDVYQAQVNQIEAQLRASEAELERARTDLTRVEEAVKTNAVSKQELTTKEAMYEMAKAEVMAQKASLTEARQEFSYTKIRSPIRGRISRHLVDAGNLVGANENTLLCRVVQLEPIHIYFDISEALLTEMMDTFRGKGPKGIDFSFGVSGESGTLHKGTIDYIDPKVNPQMGTIQLRGVYANMDRTILPGMFARIQMPTGMRKNAILVKEKALNSDIGGKYLLLVGKDNVVERRPVEVGPADGTMRVITSGLEKDDVYIYEGLQYAYPGAPVQPVFEGEKPPSGMETGGPAQTGTPAEQENPNSEQGQE